VRLRIGFDRGGWVPNSSWLCLSGFFVSPNAPFSSVAFA